MCATSSLPTVTSKPLNEKSTTKQVPKWLKMKQQNRSSVEKTAKPIVQKSSASAQIPHDETRNEKRARWAKKSKPAVKPIVRKGPVNEYLCECHNEPARKPHAAQADMVKDADSGKLKSKPKGLGKWRCATTGKITKVRPQRPAPKVLTTAAAVEVPDAS